MTPVIIARNLYKCYTGFAPVLRGVDIDVAAGEMVAVMGPSGCGKSTMLHVLGMLHAPDSGSLEILGRDVLALNREETASFRRNAMGFVMQSSNLFEHSTVFENVEFPLIYEKIPPQERWERVIRALELVRLSPRVHYRSNRLSGGEQQRVAIARAMVNNPRILLADEPTGALDAKTSRLVMENFRTLCHTGGVALVMVTHDPQMAEFCDTIYTLEDGILHCRRRNIPEIPSGGGTELLGGQSPLVRGALVAARFPEPCGQSLLCQARRMYAQGLLSRIYALRDTTLFGDSAGYSLPLAVRRVGLVRMLGSVLNMFRHMRGFSADLWGLWRALPARGRGKKAWAHLRAFCTGSLLARWGLEENMEFFFAAGAHDEATACWVASRLTKKPFAFAVRARDLADPGQDWAAKGKDAAFMLCDTQATCRTLRTLLPALQDKCFLVRDPLTLIPPEDDTEKDPASTAGPVALLAAGTLERRKGYDVLLEACALLRARGQAFTLKIVGQGPARASLRRLARQRGLTSLVEFPGQIPHENMAEMYATADIFVAPGREHPRGRTDGLPSALTEAQAFGLAVIASNLPAQTEAVQDGSNGRLVPQEDAPALAAVLEELMARPDERKRLGEAARASVGELADEEGARARLKELFLQACRKPYGANADTQS